MPEESQLIWPPGKVESLKAKLNLWKLCCCLSELKGDVLLAVVGNQHRLSHTSQPCCGSWHSLDNVIEKAVPHHLSFNQFRFGHCVATREKMSPSLSLVRSSFLNQVEQVFQADILDRSKNPANFTPPSFSCEGFGSSVKNNVHYFYDEKTRHSRGQDFCRDLFAEIDDSTCYFSRLDELFSKLLSCNFIPSELEFGIVERAYQRLIRLPETPLKMNSGTIQLDSSHDSLNLVLLKNPNPKTHGTTYKSREISAQIQSVPHSRSQTMD